MKDEQIPAADAATQMPRKTEIIAKHGGKVAIAYFLAEKIFQIVSLFFHK